MVQSAECGSMSPHVCDFRHKCVRVENTRSRAKVASAREQMTVAIPDLVAVVQRKRFVQLSLFLINILEESDLERERERERDR